MLLSLVGTKALDIRMRINKSTTGNMYIALISGALFSRMHATQKPS